MVRAGETVRRTVNLNELYELGDFGIYSVRAEIYFDAVDQFFDSRPASIELTEGRLLWKRVAGVPPGWPNAGQMHVFSLLAHQRGEGNLLFVRVEDQEDRSVFCTTALGRILVGDDSRKWSSSVANDLYVLQLVAQKAYLLSKISPNGEFLGSVQLLGGKETAHPAKARQWHAPNGRRKKRGSSPPRGRRLALLPNFPNGRRACPWRLREIKEANPEEGGPSDLPVAAAARSLMPWI